jgi:hypothetical protein
MSTPPSNRYHRDVTTFSYTLAILALPITVRARSLAQARKNALYRYLRAVHVRFSSLPVLPTIVLISTDDPRCTCFLVEQLATLGS